MSNLSFSALGFGPKAKRSVSQVCADLTKELEEIQQEQEQEASRLQEEIQVAQTKQTAALKESQCASEAIKNIKGLFGG